MSLSLHRVALLYMAWQPVGGQAAEASPAPFCGDQSKSLLCGSHLGMDQSALPPLEAVFGDLMERGPGEEVAVLSYGPCPNSLTLLTLVMVMLMICVVRLRARRVFGLSPGRCPQESPGCSPGPDPRWGWA